MINLNQINDEIISAIKEREKMIELLQSEIDNLKKANTVLLNPNKPELFIEQKQLPGNTDKDVSISKEMVIKFLKTNGPSASEDILKHYYPELDEELTALVKGRLSAALTYLNKIKKIESSLIPGNVTKKLFKLL